MTSATYVDRPAYTLRRLASLFPFFLGQKRLQITSTCTQRSSILHYTISVCVYRVHAVHDVVCQRRNNHVDFEPVVKASVLFFVEGADFLVRYAFELQGTCVSKIIVCEIGYAYTFVRLSEVLEEFVVDIVDELLLHFLGATVVHGLLDGITELLPRSDGVDRSIATLEVVV
jgi:hypothetical protein